MVRADWRPPNRSNRPGSAAVTAGGKVKPPRTKNGNNRKNNRRKGELLEHIVTPGPLPARRPQPDMVPDVLEDVPHGELVGRRRQVAAEMTAEETEQEIDGSGSEQQTRHQEVPVERQSEDGLARLREPSRKSARDHAPVRIVGNAEHPGGEEGTS